MQLGEIANTKTIKSEHSNSMYLALRYEMGCPPSPICARRALKFSRRADHCSRVPQGCLGMLTAWLVGETYSSPLPIMLGSPPINPSAAQTWVCFLLPFAVRAKKAAVATRFLLYSAALEYCDFVFLVPQARPLVGLFRPCRYGRDGLKSFPSPGTSSIMGAVSLI